MDISRYKNAYKSRGGLSGGDGSPGRSPLHSGRLENSMPQVVIVPVPSMSALEEPIQPLFTTPPTVPTEHVYPQYVEPQRPLRPVRRRHAVRNWTLRFAAVLFIALLATGGFLSIKGYDKFHKVFRGTSTVAALDAKVNPDLLNGEGDGRVNVLLLGIGGPGHDGADLTDTMLIMSVDPVNHTMALLSVPRDLWVKMPNSFISSYQKINAAYESGKYNALGKIDASNSDQKALQAGFTADDTVLKQVLGININYHLLVNFQAFKQAVDTVGGVTINVPTELYDPSMAWENNNNPILAPVGTQTMNGTKALMYARSRETSSDFARTERQRQIIVALKDKILTAGTLSNPAKLNGLLNAFGDNVYSDMSPSGAERFYSIIKQINNNKIQSIGLADPPNNFVTTDHVGNLSVVRPVAGFNNYTAIQNFVRTQLKDGFIVKEKAPITVVNGSTTAAATQAEADLLKSYGYNVTSVVTTQLNYGAQGTAVVDLSKGKDPYTARYLQTRYENTLLSGLPAGLTIPSGSAKFAIIVGQYESTAS